MRKLYIIIGSLFILFGCTEPLEVEEYTVPKMITGKTQTSWKMRNVQIVRVGKGTLTVSPEFFFGEEDNPCQVDNIYTFVNNAERTLRITEGSLKCNAGDPNLVYEGSWSFVNATATLTFFMPVLTTEGLVPFTVTEANENSLVIDLYYTETSSYRFNFRPTDTD